jgi:hypothetical protein
MSFPSYRPARRRYLGTVGDINPAEYGGGHVVRIYPDGQPSYLAIEVVEWDSDEDDATGHLYRADIPADVAAEYDWIEVGKVADYVGDFVGDWLEHAKDKDPVTRARCVEDIARYYGWTNLDSYPVQVTRANIRKRWANVGKRR